MFELDGWKFVEPYATSGTLHLIGLLSDGGVHSRLACCLGAACLPLLLLLLLLLPITATAWCQTAASI